MRIKEIFVRPNDLYKYELQINTDSITILKYWNTGPDPRDAIGSALTFRKEDYKEIINLIALYIDKTTDSGEACPK
jgi:hypothetical protein